MSAAPKPYGWHCELVHTKSATVVQSTFSREGPIEGEVRGKLHGFSWRATALYTADQTPAAATSASRTGLSAAPLSKPSSPT